MEDRDLLKAVYSELLFLRQDHERLHTTCKTLAGNLEFLEARMTEGLQRLENRLPAQQSEEANAQGPLAISSQLESLQQSLSSNTASPVALLQVTAAQSQTQSLVTPQTAILEQLAQQQSSQGLSCLGNDSIPAQAQSSVQELISETQQNYTIPQSRHEGIATSQPQGIPEEHDVPHNPQPVGGDQVPSQHHLFVDSPAQLGFAGGQSSDESLPPQIETREVLDTSSIGVPVHAKRGEQLSSQLQLLGQQQGLSQEDLAFLTSILFKSSSRTNFAVNMVRRLVPCEVRKISNCSGTKGKSKLDEKVLEQARKAAFQMFPLGPAETPQQAWRGCIKAIDESCRRLNYKRISKGRKEITEELQSLDPN